MRRKRFKIVNADVTVVAQQPKLAPHYGRIRQSIASLCGVAEGRINIKATTTEKLGWTGTGKGLAATAVVLLSR
jgi:2-C-methyl-D-erythritol 2,4-cyclodiphosphate synthase